LLNTTNEYLQERGISMRDISTSERLLLRELLQMESNAVAKAKGVQGIVDDDELTTTLKTGIQASEARVKGMMQFITEHNIIETEVH
jgi:hypothetical protein